MPADRASKKKTRYLPVRLRKSDGPFLSRLRRVARKADRPISQIVRDGTKRELDDIEANHPAFNRGGHPATDELSSQETAQQD